MEKEAPTSVLSSFRGLYLHYIAIPVDLSYLCLCGVCDLPSLLLDPAHTERLHVLGHQVTVVVERVPRSLPMHINVKCNLSVNVSFEVLTGLDNSSYIYVLYIRSLESLLSQDIFELRGR
jgi:hypothetical protein